MSETLLEIKNMSKTLLEECQNVTKTFIRKIKKCQKQILEELKYVRYFIRKLFYNKIN